MARTVAITTWFAVIAGEAAVYGLTVTMFAIALFFFMMKRDKTSGAWLLMINSSLIFLINTAHFGLNLAVILLRISGSFGSSGILYHILSVLGLASCYLSTLVITWRIWVLHRNSLWSRLLLTLAWAGILFTSITFCVILFAAAGTNRLSYRSLPVYCLLSGFLVSLGFLVWWHTAFVAYKTWTYRRDALVNFSTRNSGVQAIVVFSTEAVLLNCGTWSICLGVFIIGYRDPWTLFALLPGMLFLHNLLIMGGSIQAVLATGHGRDRGPLPDVFTSINITNLVGARSFKSDPYLTDSFKRV